MEREMRKKSGNQQKDNKDNKTIKRKEMEAKARKGKAHRFVRLCYQIAPLTRQKLIMAPRVR